VKVPEENSKGGGDKENWVMNEISPKWIRVDFNEETIVDSKRAILMREAWHRPVYYFPPEDVRTDLLVRTDNFTH